MCFEFWVPGFPPPARWTWGLEGLGSEPVAVVVNDRVQSFRAASRLVIRCTSERPPRLQSGNQPHVGAWCRPERSIRFADFDVPISQPRSPRARFSEVPGIPIRQRRPADSSRWGESACLASSREARRRTGAHRRTPTADTAFQNRSRRHARPSCPPRSGWAAESGIRDVASGIREGWVQDCARGRARGGPYWPGRKTNAPSVLVSTMPYMAGP